MQQLVSEGIVQFQSTLPGWGATRCRRRSGAMGVISIHAPRMGSDRVGLLGHLIDNGFQSTLPGWGATGPPDLKKP